jgi:DNA-directed RNA polymerase specialized sigma24 family protein
LVKGIERMGRSATNAEVREAIGSLTDAELTRLGRYAWWRVQAIGKGARGNKHEDLLQEAIVRTLDGRRTWNRSAVDFIGHLIGVIRSIASEWAESLEAERHEEPLLETELVRNPDGTDVNPFQSVVSPAPGFEKTFEAQDSVSFIREFFRDDPEVLEIMEGLAAELKGPEICEILGISRTAYETVMRRLRRSLPKIFPEGIYP